MAIWLNKHDECRGRQKELTAVYPPVEPHTDRIMGAMSIKQLFENKAIKLKDRSTECRSGEVIHIRVGRRCFTMRGALAQANQRGLADIQERYALSSASLAEERITLDKGKVYLVEIIEEFSPRFEGRLIIAPQFCSWMLNVRCRQIWLNNEGKRSVWLELTPMSFPIAINYGQWIANVRLCLQPYQDIETISESEQPNLLYSAIGRRPGEQGVIVAGDFKEVADLSKGLACVENVDWQAAPDSEGGIILEPHKIYIVPIREQELSQLEISAAELIPYDPRTDKLQLWRRLFLPAPKGSSDRMALRKVVVQGFAVPFQLANSIPLGLIRYRELEHPRPPEDFPTLEDEEVQSLFVARGNTH